MTAFVLAFSTTKFAPEYFLYLGLACLLLVCYLVPLLDRESNKHKYYLCKTSFYFLPVFVPLNWSNIAVQTKFYSLFDTEFIGNYESKVLILLNFIFMMGLIAMYVVQKRMSTALANKINKITPQQLNEQIEAKLEAESKILELQSELEQKVLERTAILCSANQDLRQNTCLMERIIDLTPNIIYVYDLVKRCNIYSNSFVSEIFGYSASEVESMNTKLFNPFVHPEDVAAIAKHHQRCLELKQGDCLSIEYRMQDSVGKWHWLESKDTVFERDASGKPIQILGVTQDITETKQIQSEAIRLNLELESKVTTLETWHDKRLKLATMNEFLQACLTIEEAQKALTDLLQPLFPNTHGAVYLMNSNENSLKAIANWGIINSEGSLEPDHCWALRQGNKHVAYPRTPGIYCKHVNTDAAYRPTLCLPMIAKGKTLGMLYLRFGTDEPIDELMQELSKTVAQNIAMSFANLKLQEKLRNQSQQDALTQLYNRRFLQESLEKEIIRAYREQRSISIIMIDIDYFKKFNDIYGHAVGDLVLKRVGSYLTEQIRPYDLACRYGGEELLIVVPGITIGEAMARAEKIRQGVKKLKLCCGERQIEPISVSVGVSCFPDDGTTVDSLIQSADKALYLAKQKGRDCVRHYQLQN